MVASRKRFNLKRYLIILILLVIGISFSVYFYQSLIKHNNEVVSPAKEGNTDVSGMKDIPLISQDNKKIEKYFASDNSNYIIFSTFVKERGAGSEYDYWIYNRQTHEQNNLSKLIKQDQNYVQKLKNDPNYNKLYLDFANRWSGEDPVFQIADGWQIVDNYLWKYDINKAAFVRIANPTPIPFDK